MALVVKRFTSGTVVGYLVAACFVSAAFLYAFPSPTVAYVGVVLLHAGIGLATIFAGVAALKRGLLPRGLLATAGWAVFSVGAALGVVLLFIGTARPQWNWLYAHILTSLVAVVLLAAWAAASRGIWPSKWPGGLARVVVAAILAAGIAYAAHENRDGRWVSTHKIQNPTDAPATMAGEGDGPSGPFFPSSAQTTDGKLVPSKFFMESESCKRCHQDIYNQWYASAHHYSSFNNQWYRKSIEYMQDVVGTSPSKWCGGCHDPALLYSGMMNTPIRQIVHTPQAQAGLGCVMCHSIAKVKSTMGQGDFVLEYPTLHDLAATKNPILRVLHDYLIRLNPEPHRRVFLKPFMRTQTAEFCSACHKVHLDVPVNHYRWIRGFNEYDNWQASGVSGQGARSFYYPPKSAQCADCHMPLTRSEDDGNVKGIIHSHSFPGANTALPTANEDPKQLKLTEDFLKDSVTADVFAMTSTRPLVSAAVTPEIATSFGVGEEAQTNTPASQIAAAAVTAPLDRVHASVRRGDDVLVDVVVRTRRVGHFFPGGTIDAYDTWVELKATDDKGQVLFWSGKIEDDGKGPVDKGAHFYRSLMIDEHGNRINKRNAWSTRAVVYVRLIPPGAADTVHYHLHIPDGAGNKITLHARLYYRKFSWWYTQFAYAGLPDAAAKSAKYSTGFDDRGYTFSGKPRDVSGEMKQIPNLPAVALAESEATVRVLPASAPPPASQIALKQEDWTRWNDYGIGLLLEGDLKAAQAAFSKITEINPKNPDGWVNLGRVAVQEGDMARARQVLERALALDPHLARANFFYAKVLRNDGEYGEAEQHLRTVLAQYPRDRVALNELGRILFLQRQYATAKGVLDQVVAIDPEDLQARYNLMLCEQALGHDAAAEHQRRLYARFKADEASQALTGDYRRTHPEDNNERQSIHEHVSVPLPALRNMAPARKPQPKKSVAVPQPKSVVSAKGKSD